MRLQLYKRINKGDFAEDEQSLVEKLSFILNNSIELLYTLANRRISLQDNMLCNVKTVTVTVKSADGTLKSQPEITVDFIKDNPILGLQVLRAENQTSTKVFPSAGIHVSFSNTSTGLKITNVVGLPVDNEFVLTLVIWGT